MAMPIPALELPDEAALVDGMIDAGLLRAVDDALQSSGFLLINDPTMPRGLAANVRAAAHEFFRLPLETKERFRSQVGGRGWLPFGVEANGYAEGLATPPDRKESFSVGPGTRTGNAAVDKLWFAPNVWPEAVPALESLVTSWSDHAHGIADRLLMLMALSVGGPVDLFTRHTQQPSWSVNLNWYPAFTSSHLSVPGQYRIGPHTDFGTVTVLDRERGAGGLQVHMGKDGWVDVPYVPGGLTVNIGDLLARWTGDRWRSTRHRVLPPDPSAPEEELLSLVFFYEADPSSRVETLPPPLSRTMYEPVTSGDYILDRLRTITVG